MFRITVSCGSDVGLVQVSQTVPRRPLAYFLGGAATPAPLAVPLKFPEQRGPAVVEVFDKEWA